jgi:hypothetical protein
MRIKGFKGVRSSNFLNFLIKPRARDYYTASTLIGGKGGAGPSSLNTALEGPMEKVNARWM